MTTTATAAAGRRVGIVGFGHLGQYLVEAVLARPDFELVFVWNRSREALVGKVEEKLILDDLSEAANRSPDLIVEVAHPDITAQYGQTFLECADFMVGSPTAFASSHVEETLRAAADKHGVYVPSGAFWGGEDIKKMADRGVLKSLKVSMKKHPQSFKLNEPLKSKNATVNECTVLYGGPVRALCSLAPNNVNTMAAAALAAHNLGFDGVEAELVADPELTDAHIVEVEAWGVAKDGGKGLHVHTVRKNPAIVGHVTGSATYTAFLSSLLGAKDKGSGVHLC